MGVLQTSGTRLTTVHWSCLRAMTLSAMSVHAACAVVARRADDGGNLRAVDAGFGAQGRFQFVLLANFERLREAFFEGKIRPPRRHPLARVQR